MMILRVISDGYVIYFTFNRQEKNGAVALTKKIVSAVPFLHSMKNKAFATFSAPWLCLNPDNTNRGSNTVSGVFVYFFVF